MKDVPVVWARPNKWLRGLSYAPFALALALLLITIATGTAFAAIAPHLIGLGFFARFFLRRRNPLPEMVPGSARVTEGVLECAGERIPLAEIKNAVIVPNPPNPSVLIERRRLKTPMRLVMANTEEARDLLRLVGYDATQRTLQLSAMPWTMSTTLRTFATIFGAMGITFAIALLASVIAPPLAALAPLSMVLMLLAFVIPSRVTVGGDGVLVEWLRWKRFVPIAEIRSAALFDEGMGRNRRVGVNLALRNEIVRIHVGAGLAMEKAKALLERIDEVRSAKGAKAIGEVATETFLARVARTTKDTKAWLADLRALGTGELATHRVAPVDPETLLRLVDDPQAPAPARVAAAVALKSSGHGDADQRIRVAAETAAHPKLRVALERSIEDDEAALIEAVDELEAAR